MYHFVLLDNRTWYLKPHTEQDILDHFNKVMAREFKLGFEDRKEGTHVIKGINDPSKPEIMMNHPSSPWRIAVEMEMAMKNQSWVEAADSLEKRTLQLRLQLLNDGRTVYLSNNLTFFVPNTNDPPLEINEVWKEELEYPTDKWGHDFDHAVCVRTDDGRWEVWIHGDKVRDEYGRDSWSIKAYAMEMARKYCNRH